MKCALSITLFFALTGAAADAWLVQNQDDWTELHTFGMYIKSLL
ncbi:hypothetical protein SCARR_00965 [Pontiella sulfatireligans]|uniref:Uncharacterized protein n=1 Tax=Pontiella sulfatireligans TaxID=2750658 RepID=A0A6C2UFB8_9BACT|nr:hypothetical protein SCARR_00965 [Pontiella sulfatireligans]